MTGSAGNGERRIRADRLTRRELEVLRFVVARYSNAEIASALTLSKRTVESHVSSLRRKLGARDRAALMELGRALLPGRDSPEPDGTYVPVFGPGEPAFGRSIVLTSPVRLEVAEARYRLSQLLSATRSTRARATQLRSRSAQRLRISMRKVELTRDALVRTHSAIAASPDGRDDDALS